MTSPDDSFRAVDRGLGTADRDGREVRRLTLGRAYPTTTEDLWAGAHRPRAGAALVPPADRRPQVGGRYQLEGNAGGEVLACDPPRSLAVTWEYGGQVSWVTVTLTPAGDGTRLELVHDVPADEHWNTYGPGAVGIGWEMGLRGLAEHVASGEAVDPQGSWPAWRPTRVAPT